MSEMKNRDFRRLDKTWDLIVVGGGITGSAILKEAGRCGLKAILLEQRDFAWGTSSRSSKMIHGGLRYLSQGQLNLTRESLKERERLLKEAPGLIDSMCYVFPHFKKVFPPPFLFRILIIFYEILAGRRTSRFSRASDGPFLLPHFPKAGFRGATIYEDAVTDDARLVLRIINEAKSDGAEALNYLRVEDLKRDESGKVNGVNACCQITGERVSLTATVVVNSTGVWADELRKKMGKKPMIRPLRGSHVVLKPGSLPVSAAITFMHPQDQRPVFIYPWLGTTVVGTTDIDHKNNINKDPMITREEVDYLLEGLLGVFSDIPVGEQHVISTWSGVRPVITSGAKSPSQEKRSHTLDLEDGLLTIMGGKLTTFRVMASEVIAKIAPMVGGAGIMDDKSFFNNEKQESSSDEYCFADSRRIYGYFGELADSVFSGNHEAIPGTPYFWSEVEFSLKNESVFQLDDLMLRRTRLGMILHRGGEAVLEKVGSLCQKYLGWTDERWQQELARYVAIYEKYYSLPGD